MRDTLDIKPANILITADDRAVLVDFGLARQIASSGLTASNVSLGTPRAMAPEQIRGDPLDQRADLYSLALVLYEMLAGQLPLPPPRPKQSFTRTCILSRRQSAKSTPWCLRRLRRRWHVRWLNRPNARFPTVAAFAAALRHDMPAPPALRTARRLPARRSWLGLAVLGSE